MESLQQYVTLSNARFFAYHGFYPEEQITGNEFIVDIETRLAAREPLSDDNLANTVNYEQLYAISKSAMAEPKKLLETVAHQILTDVRTAFNETEEVWVSISKINPPFGGDSSLATVKLHWKK